LARSRRPPRTNLFLFTAPPAAARRISFQLRKEIEKGESKVIFSYNEWLARAENGEPSKVLEFPEEATEWLAVREDEALKIDPDTAEVWFDYGRYSDPYNLYPKMPDWAGDQRDHTHDRLHFVRRYDGDVFVWAGHLPDDVRTAIWDGRQLEDYEIPFIKELTDLTSPIRFYRRCSTMCGGQIVNDDRPTRTLLPLEGEEFRAIVRWEALTIDPDTADVCQAKCDRDPYEHDEPVYDERYLLRFYRRRASGVWVPETCLYDALRKALEARIASRGIKVLWMKECDD
jgi:hypothetical protein